MKRRRSPPFVRLKDLVEGALPAAARCTRTTSIVAAVQCASDPILQSAPETGECEQSGAAPPSE